MLPSLALEFQGVEAAHPNLQPRVWLRWPYLDRADVEPQCSGHSKFNADTPDDDDDTAMQGARDATHCGRRLVSLGALIRRCLMAFLLGYFCAYHVVLCHHVPVHNCQDRLPRAAGGVELEMLVPDTVISVLDDLGSTRRVNSQASSEAWLN